MNKYVFILLLLITATACCPYDPPVLIDYGKIPDSILVMVPYQNGQIYKFRHSGGLAIEFTAMRQSNEKWQGCENEWCCQIKYKYEENTTTLIPDYPVFSFGLDLENMHPEAFGFIVRVGYYWFQVPTNGYQSNNCGFADSLLIGDKFYYDVFKIKSIYGTAYDRDTIFADSMYYSYKKGILQVKMSNGEKYSIDE